MKKGDSVNNARVWTEYVRNVMERFKVRTAITPVEIEELRECARVLNRTADELTQRWERAIREEPRCIIDGMKR